MKETKMINKIIKDSKGGLNFLIVIENDEGNKIFRNS